MPFAPVVHARSIVLIPGDQATQAMVAAVKLLKADPVLESLTFRIVPQSLLDPTDLVALEKADIVFARHLVGAVGERVTSAMQAVAARGHRIYGTGQNEGASAKLGLREDLALRAYADAGGAENLANMVRFALKRDYGYAISAAPPRALPQVAALNHRTGQLFETFEDYAASYLAQRLPTPANTPAGAAARPWVGVVLSRGQAIDGLGENIQAIADALEHRGFNVLPVYGFPSTVPVERFFLDSTGRPHVAAVVALAMKLGNVPDKIIPLLERLNVPLVNGIVLYKATHQEWENSPLGLDHNERSWQVGGPELAGIVAPTVVASKERRKDKDTGLEYVAEVPIPERIGRLADRVRKLVDLRVLPPQDKRIAIVYYNQPAGAENVGASYLNVLPRSLWHIAKRLEAEGYNAQGLPPSEAGLFDRLHTHGTNIADSTPGALAERVRSGEALLLPMADYRRWFDAQPKALRDSMVKSWGEPENFKSMVWRDPQGKAYFVFAAQRFGNLLFAPQPVRGWGDVKKMYHDVTLAPHHQYLAFYLWLQKGFQAHAMVHVGTHGTHEWLPGKEVGFTPADPSEAMVGAIPQVYPYSVDVVGEGLQAKRRGMATLISHMTPPFDSAGLSPDLVKLHGLFEDYGVAKQQSESAAAATLHDINRQAGKMGLLKDLGRPALHTAEDIEALHDYLHDIEDTQTPFGLHTFGVAPSEALRRSTADAMVDRMGAMMPAEFEKRVEALSERMVSSAKAELDALVAALAGRYVAAGPGGDPLRSPASLPTGKNIYGFDPSRIPAPGVYEQGAALAETLLKDYRQRKGQYPDRLLFNLWSGETMRHGGVLESQILALMGVRPVWDTFGRIADVELIPRTQLGRPRVDVVITPSGLYRDSLPTLMLLLDKAVNMVKDQPEADNPIRAHVLAARKALEDRGVPPELAARMAAVRLFTDPPGAYGTGLDNVVRASNSWSQEGQIADVYFKRMGHLFGQGFWGDSPGAGAASGGEGAELAVDVFKMALKDVKAVLHSRASNLYGTLDNDDVFQFLGGAALAVRQVNGSTPETLLVNLADLSRTRTETLDQFMGREMHTRYLNPSWIKAMLGEGYAGARFVMQVTDNLWGWQVTVPEAVDGAKWQAMFETYVQDKHQLDIRQKFRDAKNMRAFQAMVDRMLVAVNKGYWKADAVTVAALEAANLEAIQEAGVACDADSCSSENITRMAQAQDRQALRQAQAGFGLERSSALATAVAKAPAQALDQPRPPAPRPLPAPEVVRGQEMREVKKEPHAEQLVWIYAGLIALAVLGGMGYQAWRTRRESGARTPPSTLSQ
ncbi:MAG: cobaltochelatase subunit CobN [Rhodoferax sp.]|nr:cobaltochelatase subunit CobN [Rhodoferax sp.]MDP3650559.1 cobaltochelatase subunit CobN [Rhodoferax sp.]